ncbi:MAG: hypothetical protein U0350_08215 [Caldilineaceae bacterium]
MKTKAPKKSQPKIHDSGYKKLFSNRTIFQQLIETFITETWVKELDFSKCETLDKSFITDLLQRDRTRSDLQTEAAPEDRVHLRPPGVPIQSGSLYGVTGVVLYPQLLHGLHGQL